MTLSRVVTLAVMLNGAVALPAFAQQSTPPTPSASSSSTQSTTQSQGQTGNQPMTSQQVLKQEEKQRALGVVPMFSMTNVKNAPPLTTGEKFHLMARSLIDPFTFVAVGLQAGIGQAEDSFHEYGQGAEGYGKRYGAALADSSDSNFFSNFVYPSLFKQDPRYFRLGEGTFKKRFGYAVESEFVARKDSGGRTFHFSNVLGALTSGAISNAYYPDSDRGAGLTFNRAGIALGYGCLGNAALEFWPDIDRKLFHKNQNQPSPGEPTAAPSK